MVTDIAWLVAGFVLLATGGNALVVGASSLALRLGLPPFLIGITVVGFGTSAPELAVNLQAAYSGETGVSFGNVIGSNIANIALILGACALVRPLAFDALLIRREVPMGILAI
ncbi:MAG: sodium:calcium antiporter, partial [Planctomycetes bacterium]|nr:sodium:calcium antiporter [Planctomycetota bacterium]